MSTDLSKIPNIGKDTETKLMQVGITSYAELKAAGTEQAFLRLQTLDPGLAFICCMDLKELLRVFHTANCQQKRNRNCGNFIAWLT